MIAFAEQLHVVLIDRPELFDRYCRRSVVGIPDQAIDELRHAHLLPQ